MKREAIIYLAGRFLPAVLSLAFIILAIRYLGPVVYGRYSLLFYSALIAITFTFHWVQVSMLKFLGHPSREFNVVVGRFYDLTVISALISTAIVFLVSFFYFHSSPSEWILVCIFTFLTHFYLFHMAILQVHHRSVRTAIIEGSDQAIMMAVFLAGMFFAGWKSPSLIFGALVLGLAGVLALRFFIRAKGLFSINKARFYWDSRFFGKAVAFGYSVMLWLLFSHILMAFDRFVLMVHFGYENAGSYSALKDLISKVVIFSSLPIYISYKAKVLDLWHTNQKAGAWGEIKEALNFQLLIYILIFIVFMVIKSKLFDSWLGIPEMNSWKIYLPLLFSAYLWQMALLLQRYVKLLYRTNLMLTGIVLIAIFNVVVNLTLLPVYGIMVSSLAMLASSALYLGFIVVLSITGRRKLTVELKSK